MAWAAAFAGCFAPIEGDDHGDRNLVCYQVTLRVSASLIPTQASPSDVGYVRGSFEENHSAPSEVEIKRIADYGNTTKGRSKAGFLGLSSDRCPRANDVDDVLDVLVEGENRLAWVYAIAPDGFSEDHEGSETRYRAAHAWLYDI